MTLFENIKEMKEEKAAKEKRELLEKYGLGNLTDQQDIESVLKIISKL